MFVCIQNSFNQYLLEVQADSKFKELALEHLIPPRLHFSMRLKVKQIVDLGYRTFLLADACNIKYMEIILLEY